ncbi:aspartyl-phosphate phosphatase Spo0E family protein [Alkalihalobacillus pseudalcaliphilus]|uniref:aspartyl-phosphate phosphatase Spo0E family protein n=1 Tax=Alkalihalobacillus pseudalcaliphilus TaxID=79884 RepID=UPI000A418AFB|nr:aspartyl-phosphate phosphatase Spo0E family protein [Alkalihalobacillus pseudalcaliphilus]
MPVNQKEWLETELEKVRKELLEIAQLKGICHVDVLRKSEELDKLITFFMNEYIKEH